MKEALLQFLTGVCGGVLPTLFCRVFWREFLDGIEELGLRLDLIEHRLPPKPPEPDPVKQADPPHA